jgi:hypothetical protein
LDSLADAGNAALAADLLGDPARGRMANLQRLPTDRLFGLSLYNTAYSTLFSVPLRH